MRPRFLVPLALAAWIVPAYYAGLAPAQTPPAPAPQQPAVQPAPAPAPTPTPGPAPASAPAARHGRHRGARSSRHHWLAYQATRHPRFVHAAAPAPAQFTPAIILTPSQMSYWGNDQFGDCVSAEEAFAKDIYPVWYSNAGKPVLLPTATVTTWARQHGYLNGADLTSVMDDMARDGMALNGVTYTDGPYQSVDFTNWATLTSAIYQGPVKIGVASGQFDNVQGVGENNGWVMHGFRNSNAEDHCVALCGYGTMSYLAAQMGVTLPSGVDGTANGLLLFTWDTIGLIDFASMKAITGEAWLRTPTTPQTPPLPPTPTPTPAPGGFTFVLGVGAPADAKVDSTTGAFSWTIPAGQPAGTVTIPFSVANAAGTASGSFAITITTATSGIPVVSPIPAQSAATGSTVTLDLSKFVTAAPAGVTPAPQAPPHPAPAPAPGPSASAGRARLLEDAARALAPATAPATATAAAAPDPDDLSAYVRAVSAWPGTAAARSAPRTGPPDPRGSRP